jgi:putative endonuclease
VYYTYILQLSNKSYYHGFSDNLKTRLKAHEEGLVSSTKNLRPLRLVFYAAFVSKKKALDFEEYLKTNSGFAFRNKRLLEKE